MEKVSAMNFANLPKSPYTDGGKRWPRTLPRNPDTPPNKVNPLVSQRKKIYHFLITNSASGQEAVVANIIDMVDGYEHYYVCPDGPINDFLAERGIRHIPVPSLTPLTVRKVLQRDRPDIAHGHDVTASVCLAVNALFCHRHGIKLISHLHNNDTRMHKVGVRSIVYGVASLAFTSIIAVSDPVVDEYVFRFLIEKKATTVVNVINPQNIADKVKGVNTAIRRWDVAAVGRLADQKDPLMFVDIIAEMNRSRETTAVMVGNGDMEQQVREHIRERGLEGKIELAGFQTNPYTYIVRSSLMMMPSKYEGYPMVALEALMLGAPFLGTPVAGISEIVDERCGYLCTDVQEFVDRALSVLGDTDLRASLSRGAMERSGELNDVTSFVGNLKSIYG